MTIASPNNRNDYVGNNATAAYPYGFRIFLKTDLLVTERSTVGVETVLTVDVDYTVDGVGAAGGGNVNLQQRVPDGLGGWIITPYNLPTGYALTIKRVRPITQLTSIRNQGNYFPATHEDAFDNACMVDQQLQEQINRSVALPTTIAPSAFNPQLPATLALNPNASLIVNASGTGWDLSIGGSPVSRYFYRDTYPNMQAAAVAAPTVTRCAFATDIKQWVLYCADTSIGDAGWLAIPVSFIGG